MVNAVTPAREEVVAPQSDEARPIDPLMVLHARVVTGSGGGPDKTILNSPRFLTSRGYDCTCLYLRPANDVGFDSLRRRAQALEAPLMELDDAGPFDWSLVRRAADVCQRLGVAIWHGHDYKTNLLGVLVQRRWPMHLVTTVHGWVHNTWRTRLYYAIDRWALRRYERILCVSADLLAECRRMGIGQPRSLQVDNAIDTAQFVRAQSIADAKRALNWPAQRLLIGAVGRLSQEKGFDLLIRAVAELVRRGHDVGAAIAGDGPQRPPLEGLIANLGVSDRVRLLGFQADVIPLYEAMDLYALSSHREGLPNVVLEAMAMETPVVATRIAGVPDLMDDGVNGVLIPPGNVDALTSGLEAVIVDPDRRRELAVAGRQTVEDRFSFDRRMDKVAAIYDELLGRSQSAPAGAERS